jgi:hypothetical protein
MITWPMHIFMIVGVISWICVGIVMILGLLFKIDTRKWFNRVVMVFGPILFVVLILWCLINIGSEIYERVS